MSNIHNPCLFSMICKTFKNFVSKNLKSGKHVVVHLLYMCNEQWSHKILINNTNNYTNNSFTIQHKLCKLVITPRIFYVQANQPYTPCTCINPSWYVFALKNAPYLCRTIHSLYCISIAPTGIWELTKTTSWCWRFFPYCAF